MPHFARPRDVVLHYDHHTGDARVRPIVFANSLGTDLRIWDDVRTRLDPDIPVLAMDKRGHGLSGSGPADIATLAHDVADMMDHLGLSEALICGVSVGGLIAQALATSRPDLVAGLVLSNTGMRIGSAESWAMRIEAVEAGGLESIAEAVMRVWFAPSWTASNPDALAGWRQMLVRTPAAGYVATCGAIRDADLTAATSTLRLPALCIAGAADGATPHSLVEALARTIPGAAYECLDDVGHLPCIEAPERVAALLSGRLVVRPAERPDTGGRAALTVRTWSAVPTGSAVGDGVRDPVRLHLAAHPAP